jgi:hypothetical protein
MNNAQRRQALKKACRNMWAQFTTLLYSTSRGGIFRIKKARPVSVLYFLGMKGKSFRIAAP